MVPGASPSLTKLELNFPLLDNLLKGTSNCLNLILKYQLKILQILPSFSLQISFVMFWTIKKWMKKLNFEVSIVNFKYLFTKILSHDWKSYTWIRISVCIGSSWSACILSREWPFDPQFQSCIFMFWITVFKYNWLRKCVLLYVHLCGSFSVPFSHP